MVALYYTLYYFCRVLNYAILAFCILSWFAQSNQKLFRIYCILGKYLWPIFGPARWILQKLYAKFKIYSPVDFTPWLTMILINIAFDIFVKILLLFWN